MMNADMLSRYMPFRITQIFFSWNCRARPGQGADPRPDPELRDTSVRVPALHDTHSNTVNGAVTRAGTLAGLQLKVSSHSRRVCPQYFKAIDN